MASLVAHGARVAVVDLPVVPPDWFAESESICYVHADVTDRCSLEAALTCIASRWEAPFGLINNAALDSPPGSPAEENGPFESYPNASFRRVMEVNVTGVFLACQVFGGAMAKAGRGSVVNIGSTYGLVSPNQDLYQFRRDAGEEFFKPVAYSVSKSALLNMTRYLATYWGEAGVRVNTLCFGGVFNNQDERFLVEYAKRVPMRRMAREDEYNGAAVFLMSDASSYMTGATMIIDGGWTAW
ncbi:NAD(P)-dependent dehydrogenase, short-chain alcohol dehydrogenase family [Humidesulfovibrio mexicanus]|uniref:NAD(P)-dependent dehydrogenase, short-chain alcohol dehydrogenase family n=2 Tax=Humidesulfovibrio mexicanus TaxID=147047 RepID=A0A238Y932_9BACT|nr:NAD(P)-dependent dehydrogenase, short-chain alcohol dehydrogenase family [Humidesulfovibrio mexicanus]